MRVYCTECNDEMTEGYEVHDGLYHYCKDECLYKNVSKEDYEKMYEIGYAFWTTFED